MLSAGVLVLGAGAVLGACAPAPSTSTQHLAAERVPARAERAIEIVLEGFDSAAAMGHVEFMSRYWRLAGNDGFDRSIGRIYERLMASGFAMDRARVHSYPNQGHGWDHTVGTLALVEPDGEMVPILSKGRERLALCINSFSTPGAGRVLRVVDVGRGDRAADYEGRDVKDAIVLGDADAGRLWREATNRGAAGVVSAALPPYIRPTPPGEPEPPRDEWDILQWSSIPYDRNKQSFGFKATPRAAAEMRRRLAAGPLQALVRISSSFTERPARMVIGEIPGTSLSSERIVIAAHVQEPGANDNASGVATLLELAVALERAMARGELPRPARTLTFLWIDEIAGSRQWIKDFAAQAKQVKWMFSLDMTGEDVAKTGGSFLVERWPDPGAVYDREWDPHSEWGRSQIDPKTLKGDLINDLHLAIARRVGSRTGWAVRSNPYEGGSDHTVFGSQGVPSLLDWHFTDRYYHTNFDTADKVSAGEMRNVAAAVGATAWLMASANAEEAKQVAALVARAGRERIEREKGETSKDRDAAVAAWTKWYLEAVASVDRLTAAQAETVAQAFRPADIDLILAEDRRASRPGDYELLTAAAGSDESADIRARAVRALGRLEQRHPRGAVPADLIERALGDPSFHVRATAAYALAQSVIALDAAAKAPRRAALLARLSHEEDDAAASAMMESAARLADAASIAEVERAVLPQQGIAGRRPAIASALEILSRRAGKPGAFTSAAVEWLRAAATDAALSLPARRAALQALVAQRAADAAFAVRAFETDDWQVRRLAVLAVTAPGAAPADARPLIERAVRDPDPHVRYDAVRALARRGDEGCVSLLSAARDADAHVALAAIDGLARCGGASATALLATLAGSPGGTAWHRASHALVSLATADRNSAADLLAVHLKNDAWPVRMYAAQTATRLGADETLVALAADRHPNVREAALGGLVERAKASTDAAAKARLKTAVMAALAERRDSQLLRTAAAAVAATADAPAFRAALLEALDALDAARGDTTVDARTALVDALKLAAPGEAAPPAPVPLEPMTPSAQELRDLPTRARIEMARGGVFELELFPDEAPATVARFARLARAGYYDGLTFHRVVPNFVIQGGSPWANEYSGAVRFQRDELGFGRHERGAVGISTRGRDTGDAQIFVDLVDLPRLNHDYTVFARVVSGIDVVDRILEADVIQRISILK